jgi:hypothetical protein
VSSLAPEIQAMSDAVETASQWLDKLNEIPGGLDTVVKALDPNPIHKYEAAMTAVAQEVDLAGVSAKQLVDIMSDGSGSVEENQKLWEAWAAAHPEVAIERIDRSQRDWNDTINSTTTKTAEQVTATDRAKLSMSGLAGAIGGAADAADALTREWDGLKGSISDDQAWLDIQDSFDTIAEKGKEAWEANKSGAADAEAKSRDYQRSLDTLKQQVIDYAREVLKLPPERVTKILADLDGASAAQVEAELKELTRLRYVGIKAVNVGGNLGLPGSTSAAAATASASSGGAGRQVVSVTHVTLPPGARGVDALREVTGAARRAGTRYGSAAVSRARR